MPGPWDNYQPPPAPSVAAGASAVAVPPAAAGPWQSYAAPSASPATPTPVTVQSAPLPGTTGLGGVSLVPATGGPLPSSGGTGKGANFPPWSAGVLPISSDQTGAIRFDPHAGILGSITSGATLPGDVYTGKVDPLSQEGIQRAAQLATIATPVNPAVRAGEAWLPGPAGVGRPGTVAAPTADQLYAAASSGYDKARGMGVVYTSRSVSNVAAAARTNLEQDGIIAELAPKTFSIVSKLENPPPNSTAPFTGVEAARRALGNAAQDYTNPTEAMAARRVISALDDFVTNPDPANVVAGPAADVAATVKDARGNYAAASRSDKLQGIENAADLRAAAANSGQNGDNAIRSRVASLLLNPKQLSGFSADEQALLREVAEGSASRNVLRFVGNLLGGGGGWGSVATGVAGAVGGEQVGGLPGLIAGAAIPAVGVAAKQAANAATRRSLNAADAAVRSRSPLYNQMTSLTPPTIVPNPALRSAMARALLSAGQAPPPQSAAPPPYATGGGIAVRHLATGGIVRPFYAQP